MPEATLAPEIWDALRQMAFEDGERVAVLSSLAHARERVARDARLEEARARLAEAEQAALETVTARRGAEVAIDDAKQRIQRTETTLASGRLQSERDIMTAQHELESLRQVVAAREDTWLRASDEEETTAIALAAARSAFEAEEYAAADRRAALDQDVHAAEQRLAIIDGLRRDAALKMPPAIREQYRALYQKTGGRPFAEAVAGECSNCHHSVPAAAVQMLRARTGVPACPSCLRLLLVP